MGIIHIYSPKLPQVIQDLLLYGKARKKRTEVTIVRSIEVPKRWFLHFYVMGTIINGSMLVVLIRTYVFNMEMPGATTAVLQWLDCHKQPTTDTLGAFLAVGMMAMQNTRRLYECLFVSVYSSSTINLLHYACGIYLYSAFSTAILCEAPTPGRNQVLTGANVRMALQTPHIVIGVLLFCWASYNHHVAHHTFANLRKNKEGAVVSQQHKIPTGGWFEYISCPHYFFEILIYLSMWLVLGLTHIAMAAVFTFVASNQVIAAVITHNWYKSQFKAYPKCRKALIPYVF